MNATNSQPQAHTGPIGIFDSGIGGLSVLRHLRQHLPHENFLYFADSSHAPYGDKSEVIIAARSLTIVKFLLDSGIKALVVACNTATAVAIQAIRRMYPHLPIIGIEPGLKPAVLQTRSKIVGVLATQATLLSSRLLALKQQISETTSVHFELQPCIGLVEQIEKGELRSAATAKLVQYYIAPLLAQGADTLVLGCTHYPFVRPLIEETIRLSTNNPIAIIDTSAAINRQLVNVLSTHALLQTHQHSGTVTAFTTGNQSCMKIACTKLGQAISNITALTLPTEAFNRS